MPFETGGSSSSSALDTTLDDDMAASVDLSMLGPDSNATYPDAPFDSEDIIYDFPLGLETILGVLGSSETKRWILEKVCQLSDRTNDIAQVYDSVMEVLAKNETKCAIQAAVRSGSQTEADDVV